MGAAQREHAHGFVADARVAAGHQRGFAAQVEAGRNVLGRGVEPQAAI
jgi:hypothetical protein